MKSEFIYIYDTEDERSYFINIRQIAWFDINTNTLVMSAPTRNAMFFLDDDSMKRVIEATKIGGGK